jgi:hypothetical protein
MSNARNTATDSGTGLRFGQAQVHVHPVGDRAGLSGSRARRGRRRRAASLAPVLSGASARPMCLAGRVGAAEWGQQAGAALLRFVFAEAERVGEGQQFCRPGR